LAKGKNGDTVHSISLTLADLRWLKLHSGIALELENTFINVRKHLTTDTAKVPVQSVWFEDALRASKVTKDFTPPSLLSWVIDMNSMTLNTTFSDVVLANSFYPDAVRIQSARGTNPVSKYQLTRGSSTDSEDGYTITVELSRTDSNEVKDKLSLATTQANSYLALAASAFTDTNNFNAISVIPSQAHLAAAFTNDTTGPVVESFDLNMSKGELTVSFSETIDISTVDIKSFALQNSAANSTIEYPLTALAGKARYQLAVATLMLDKVDMDQLKYLQGLADDGKSTFLRCNATGIRDMNNNQLQIIPASRGQRVKVFTRDTVPPVLVDVYVDMDTGVLSFSFSETVRADKMNVVKTITLLESANHANKFVVTNGTVTSDNGLLINVRMTKEDMDNIKTQQGLATNLGDTHVAITDQLIADMNGNRVVRVPEANARKAATYTKDKTRPSLNSFDLDMDTQVLTLSFSESMNASSLDVSSIVFFNAKEKAGNEHYTLTEGVTSTANVPVITVKLSRTDFDALSALPELCSNKTSAVLYISGGTILDMANNAVHAIAKGMEATTHTADDTKPYLESFNLNMSYGAN
jgi:hypothetical protein